MPAVKSSQLSFVFCVCIHFEPNENKNFHSFYLTDVGLLISGLGSLTRFLLKLWNETAAGRRKFLPCNEDNQHEIV